MSDGYITVAQCVEGLPLGRLVWEALLCAWLSWFLLGAINESTPLAFSFISTAWAPTEHTVLTMSAALSLGNFVAIILGGWLADRHGRLAVLRPAFFLTAVSMVLLCSRTYAQALLSRFLLGLCSGGIMGVVPTLTSELLPSRHRGLYLTVWCCGWPAGALFALSVIWLLPGLDWRLFYTILLAPATVLYACARAEMLPESPRWLYLAGHRDEGYEALMDMYEKQLVPLPWAPETIAVTSGHKRSQKCGCGAGGVVCLALAVAGTSAATQCVRLWMPLLLGPGLGHAPHAPGAPQSAPQSALLGLAASLAHAPLLASAPDEGALLVLMRGYLFETLGCLLSALLSVVLSRRLLVWLSLLGASGLALLLLTGRGCPLALLGLLMAAQGTALQFLQAFACEHTPTQRRAKALAFVLFTAQLANFALPMLVALVAQRSTTAAVLLCSATYLVAALLGLQVLPHGLSEEPLGDVDEGPPRRSAAKRKDFMNYQAI